MNDLDDIGKILWMELRFGLTKSVGQYPSNEKIESIEVELLDILNKYKNELRIPNPIPRVKIWITNNKANFVFIDRKSGRRILLGHWLAKKESYLEH